jgi:dethiobiotin synthetase
VEGSRSWTAARWGTGGGVEVGIGSLFGQNRSMNLFVTGTDTDVGKTWVAVELVKAWRAAGGDVVGMKPIACGDRTDAELLQAASGGGDGINEVNPVWFRPAVAPYTAAMIEERAVDLALVRETYKNLRSHHASVVVEGAGGWMVPILSEYAVANLAVELGVPVLVVAANRLGVLNHALLTVEAVIGRGLKCVGVILNNPISGEPGDAARVPNGGVLEDLLSKRGVPLLGEIEFGATSLPERLLALR